MLDKAGTESFFHILRGHSAAGQKMGQKWDTYRLSVTLMQRTSQVGSAKTHANLRIHRRPHQPAAEHPPVWYKIISFAKTEESAPSANSFRQPCPWVEPRGSGKQRSGMYEQHQAQTKIDHTRGESTIELTFKQSPSLTLPLLPTLHISLRVLNDGVSLR